MSSWAIEYCNDIVDHHRNIEEDYEGADCIGICILLGWDYSVQFKAEEKEIKAAHNEVNENATEMHSCICSIDNPQVDKLKHSC